MQVVKQCYLLDKIIIYLMTPMKLLMSNDYYEPKFYLRANKRNPENM